MKLSFLQQLRHSVLLLSSTGRRPLHHQFLPQLPPTRWVVPLSSASSYHSWISRTRGGTIPHADRSHTMALSGSTRTPENDDVDATATFWQANNPKQAVEAQSQLQIWPLDEHNAALLNEVHPRDYVQSCADPHVSFCIQRSEIILDCFSLSFLQTWIESGFCLGSPYFVVVAVVVVGCS